MLIFSVSIFGQVNLLLPGPIQVLPLSRHIPSSQTSGAGIRYKLHEVFLFPLLSDPKTPALGFLRWLDSADIYTPARPDLTMNNI